jgi:hypothetical protein
VASNLIVDSGLTDHGDEDVVRLAHDLNSLTGDLADDSNSQTGSREGVSANELLVNLQLPTERSHFVLEPIGPALLATATGNRPHY